MIHINDTTYYTQADTKHFTHRLCNEEEVKIVRTAYADKHFRHIDIVKSLCTFMLSMTFIIGVLSLSKMTVMLSLILTVVYKLSCLVCCKSFHHVISRRNIVRYEAIVLKKYDPIPVDGLTAVYPVLVRDFYSTYQTILYVPERLYEHLCLDMKFWRHRSLDTDKAIV